MNYSAKIDDAGRLKDFEGALKLALQWTHEDSRSPQAWSKLAYVHELLRNFISASKSIRKALDLAPNNPAYLFKAGVIAYRSGSHEAAATDFQYCIVASIDADDDYYLDAAKVARARCLIELGLKDKVGAVLVGLPDDAATWLDGRITARIVRDMAHKKTFTRR